MSINQIAEGFYNNATNKREDLFESRISICRNCKLLKIDKLFGETCNARLYLDPITNETSLIPLKGYKKGCGCVLKAKTRVKNAECPVGKW